MRSAGAVQVGLGGVDGGPRGFVARQAEKFPVEVLIEAEELLNVPARIGIGLLLQDTAQPGDALQHGVAIGGFPQRRIHLDVRVVANRGLERLVGQHEVVRRDFAGDVGQPA